MNVFSSQFITKIKKFYLGEIKLEKRKKIAWGITGAGDKVLETVRAMEKIKKEYEDKVDIEVFISKSGDQVIKYYEISGDIESNFDKTWVEINANAPF